jgi:hypothetical protein
MVSRLPGGCRVTLSPRRAERYDSPVAAVLGLCGRRVSHKCPTGQIAGITSDAVRLEPDAVHVELRVFKYGTSGHVPRVSIRIPTEGELDVARRLFRLLLADASLCRSHPWFTLRDLSAAAAAGLRAVAAHAAPGTRYTPRSLRSGGITAAYAVGVPLERIMRVSNHASTTVVLRHYLDPLVPPTPAARVFFHRFVPAARSLSEPI